jgi:hypothetical protein
VILAYSSFYTGVHCKGPECNTGMRVIASYTLPGVRVLHSWAITNRARVGSLVVRCLLITVTYHTQAAFRNFIAKIVSFMNLLLYRSVEHNRFND